MTTFCISCPAELPAAHEAAVTHFIERKVKAQFVNAIHAETFGILSWRPYRRDHPKAGSLIDMAQVGTSLSHYMVWQICMFHSDDVFLILEDDAEFSEDWRERMDKAIADAPPEWDMILIGSCNTFDKPKTHVNGELFKVAFPFATHAYLVHRRALSKLIELCRDAAKHIDIALIDYAYPQLNVLTVLPRIAGQRGNQLAD